MILVIDFGSQTAHLIGRRLRSLGVAVEIVTPEEMNVKIAKGFTPNILMIRGIIFSGGPASVYENGAPTVDKKIFSLGVPILGICYGWQLMAKLLGGKVENAKKEYGLERLKVVPCGNARNDLVKPGTVIMSHGDTVTALPKGFLGIGSTKQVRFAAVVNEKAKLFGVQFHPEAHHTEHGLDLLKNFSVTICREHLNPLQLSPKAIIADVKHVVGDKKVICAVSGGVDSTVAAFLIGKAIGKNLIPVYVDSGLMRPDTDKRVKYIFTKLIHVNVIIVDARKRFLTALKEITDPEIKRKTIGELYVDIFQEQAAKYKDASFLGQGTIYSDVIESKGSKHASRIKSHHNVGGLPKNMKFELLEPLREFYKDEVRQIGRLAGLPDDIVNQQPFPGPGFSVRIRGEVTKKRLRQVNAADRIVTEEIKSARLYDKVFQCFAVMTGAYSTAVKGDARVFAEVVAVRAYDSMDIMTGQWSKIPYDILARISSRIVNEVPGVSRVVYDITTKPPATMEWE